MKEGTDNNVIGINLQRIMKAEDVTVPMLAEWSGIAENTLHNWRQGHCIPPADRLYQVARVLKRPMEAFFIEVSHDT